MESSASAGTPISCLASQRSPSPSSERLKSKAGVTGPTAPSTDTPRRVGAREEDMAWEVLAEDESLGEPAEGSEVWQFEMESGLPWIRDEMSIKLEEMVLDTNLEHMPSVDSETDTVAMGSRSPRPDPSDPAPAPDDGPPFAVGD